MTDAKDLAQQKLAKRRRVIGVYRHYKGGVYTVYSTSVDEETGEHLVHYYSHKKKTRWTRKMPNFTGYVKHEDGTKEKRFTLIRRADIADLEQIILDEIFRN